MSKQTVENRTLIFANDNSECHSEPLCEVSRLVEREHYKDVTILRPGVSLAYSQSLTRFAKSFSRLPRKHKTLSHTFEKSQRLRGSMTPSKMLRASLLAICAATLCTSPPISRASNIEGSASAAVVKPTGELCPPTMSSRVRLDVFAVSPFQRARVSLSPDPLE